MRYKLRTLLILLAAGPPLLAGLWLFRDLRQILSYAVVTAGLIVIGLVSAHAVPAVLRDQTG
jgi:hypothetical protein